MVIDSNLYTWHGILARYLVLIGTGFLWFVNLRAVLSCLMKLVSREKNDKSEPFWISCHIFITP